MTSLLRGVTTETPSILPDGAVMGPSHAENAVPFPPLGFVFVWSGYNGFLC